MMKVPELNGDNLEDNIAINNDTENEDNNQLNGVVLLPEIKEIMLGKTLEFNVYKYINGIKQNDTFTIEVSGVPSKYFKLNILDNNNFSIENLEEYQINPLTITCIDNESGDKISKNIWLGGIGNVFSM